MHLRCRGGDAAARRQRRQHLVPNLRRDRRVRVGVGADSVDRCRRHDTDSFRHRRRRRDYMHLRCRGGDAAARRQRRQHLVPNLRRDRRVRVGVGADSVDRCRRHDTDSFRHRRRRRDYMHLRCRGGDAAARRQRRQHLVPNLRRHEQQQSHHRKRRRRTTTTTTYATYATYAFSTGRWCGRRHEYNEHVPRRSIATLHRYRRLRIGRRPRRPFRHPRRHDTGAYRPQRRTVARRVEPRRHHGVASKRSSSRRVCSP